MKTSLELLGASLLFVALAAMFFAVWAWNRCDMASFKARRFVRQLAKRDWKLK